jgi:hypothetical protein
MHRNDVNLESLFIENNFANKIEKNNNNNFKKSDFFFDANDLFYNISLSQKLVFLNLSNCKLKNCEFSRFLPFIFSLKTLDLSHNELKDEDLVVLSLGLENSTSVRFLNVSNNNFFGLKCNCVEQLFEKNKCLHYLNLNSNFFIDSIWTAMARGFFFFIFFFI